MMSDPSIATNSDHRESETFCKGYGDIAFQSSDGVVFHLSSFLLAYMSPIFKDMIDLGAKARSQAGIEHQTEPIVQLTEDSETLDLLFRHIDPKQIPLPLDERTIRKLLEAARRYQVPSVMAWFEVEVTKKVPYSNSQNLDAGASLLSRHLALVVSLALKCNLKALAEKAILYRVGCFPVQKGDDEMGPDAYHQICLLRQKRLNKYMELIRKLSNLPPDHRTPSHEDILRCRQCKYQRSSWIVDIMEAVLKAPKWETFENSLHSRSLSCSGPRSECQGWVLQVKEAIKPLQAAIRGEEELLDI